MWEVSVCALEIITGLDLWTLHWALAYKHHVLNTLNLLYEEEKWQRFIVCPHWIFWFIKEKEVGHLELPALIAWLWSPIPSQNYISSSIGTSVSGYLNWSWFLDNFSHNYAQLSLEQSWSPVEYLQSPRPWLNFYWFLKKHYHKVFEYLGDQD